MFCHDKEGVCTVPALILFQPQCQLSPMKLIHKRIEEKLLCINRTSVPYHSCHPAAPPLLPPQSTPVEDQEECDRVPRMQPGPPRSAGPLQPSMIRSAGLHVTEPISDFLNR